MNAYKYYLWENGEVTGMDSMPMPRSSLMNSWVHVPSGVGSEFMRWFTLSETGIYWARMSPNRVPPEFRAMLLLMDIA